MAITLEAAFKNNLSKSRKFSIERLAVEFHDSEVFVIGIHTNFTYDSETYDIVKLDSDSLKFYRLLILVSTQFNLYIVVINWVNVNRLIYLF